jgi:hypothetical protein
LGYYPTRSLEEELEYSMWVLYQNREHLKGLEKNFENHIRFK